jgi:hypothetical protein
MPGIYFGLQRVTGCEEGAVARCEIMYQRIKGHPKGVGINAGAGQSFFGHKIMKRFGNSQAAAVGADFNILRC